MAGTEDAVKLSLRSGRQVLAMLGASVVVGGVLAGSSPAFAGSAYRSPAVRALIPALTPVQGASRELGGVFCTSPTNCWSVGAIRTSAGAGLNQVLHWTGKKWFRVSVPNPGGTRKNDSNELLAVRCTSAHNCWAVGDYAKNGARLDQALHWTGRKWFAVSMPSPGGTSTSDVNSLNDVACTSARSCWAVGAYGILSESLTRSGTSSSTGTSEVLFNQALHWDGKKWLLVSAPNPGGRSQNDVNSLMGVRCTSVGDCWAGGLDGVEGSKFSLHDEMLHWNGARWALAFVPSPGGTARGDINEISGLSCTAPANCWAVGFFGNINKTNRALNLVLHWNGKKWLRVNAPNPDGTHANSSNALLAVSCTSSSDCWAVGDSGSITGPVLNQTLHWNGKKWLAAPSPDPGGTGPDDSNQLGGIRCVSATDCWAVGHEAGSGDPDFNEILHWNGKKWFTNIPRPA